MANAPPSPPQGEATLIALYTNSRASRASAEKLNVSDVIVISVPIPVMELDALHRIAQLTRVLSSYFTYLIIVL